MDGDVETVNECAKSVPVVLGVNRKNGVGVDVHVDGLARMPRALYEAEEAARVCKGLASREDV